MAQRNTTRNAAKVEPWHIVAPGSAHCTAVWQGDVIRSKRFFPASRCPKQNTNKKESNAAMLHKVATLGSIQKLTLELPILPYESYGVVQKLFMSFLCLFQCVPKLKTSRPSGRIRKHRATGMQNRRFHSSALSWHPQTGTASMTKCNGGSYLPYPSIIPC